MQREIGGARYRCIELPAEPALAVLESLGKVTGDRSTALNLAIRDGDIERILNELFEVMAGGGPEAAGKLVRDLAALCVPVDPPAKIEGSGALLRLAAFALEAQFRRFLQRSVGHDLNSGGTSKGSVSLTAREIEAIAPNIATRMFIMRPVMAEPQPLCSLHELRTTYTLNDLFDFHELLDLREALVRKSDEKARREADDR